MADNEKKKVSNGSFESVVDVKPEGEPHVEEVEETLHRALKARQISMIALGGAVGTGLIIGSGTALRQGGPAGILIGYSFVGEPFPIRIFDYQDNPAYRPHMASETTLKVYTF
ncbi:hypothetical protein FRC18_003051 [Serendipita sp. 400]|nr:hypothetical protein FRC18_003051 [Serendipita sp. 400]